MFVLQDSTVSKLTREIEVLKKDLRERDKLLSNANIKVSFLFLFVFPVFTYNQLKCFLGQDDITLFLVGKNVSNSSAERIQLSTCIVKTVSEKSLKLANVFQTKLTLESLKNLHSYVKKAG